MDYIKLYENIDKYIDSVKELDIYKEYINLTIYIKDNYADLINKYKLSKAKYEDALSISTSYPGISNLKNNYILAKGELFSKEEVKEYFNLTHKLEDIFNNDLKVLRTSILKESE